MITRLLVLLILTIHATPSIDEVVGSYQHEGRCHLTVIKLLSNGEFIETDKRCLGAFETKGKWKLSSDTVIFYPQICKDLWHPREIFTPDTTLYKLKYIDKSLVRINKKGHKHLENKYIRKD
jgi:hypothetical protein